MNLVIIAGVVGPWQIILIVAVALLMFGGKKIPELMGGIGKGMKEFKKAIKEEDEKPDTTSKDVPRVDNKKEPLKE
ncbi:MAG: twin-arginine translocase TatA/TatE family subunit [Bacteroidia bacterium]|nr:twin-arginine translocase TatA/TatE family subunit [Bacteroidia bacterium]